MHMHCHVSILGNLFELMPFGWKWLFWPLHDLWPQTGHVTSAHSQTVCLRYWHVDRWRKKKNPCNIRSCGFAGRKVLSSLLFSFMGCTYLLLSMSVLLPQYQCMVAIFSPRVFSVKPDSVFSISLWCNNVISFRLFPSGSKSCCLNSMYHRCTCYRWCITIYLSWWCRCDGCWGCWGLYMSNSIGWICKVSWHCVCCVVY